VAITVRGGNLAYDYTHAIVRGSYRIDPACKPLHLDWTPLSGGLKGETLKVIYQIDGDELRIAFLWNGTEMQRPRGFNDDGVYTAIFKRVK